MDLNYLFQLHLVSLFMAERGSCVRDCAATRCDGDLAVGSREKDL